MIGIWSLKLGVCALGLLRLGGGFAVDAEDPRHRLFVFGGTDGAPLHTDLAGAGAETPIYRPGNCFAWCVISRGDFAKSGNAHNDGLNIDIDDLG